MKPISYFIRSCCANCKNVFKMCEYDGGHLYYCHIDKSERPKCGSPFLKESFVFCSDDEFGRYMTRWEEWSDPRAVLPWGCCANHKCDFEDSL